ncbi:hypothetical protein AAFC00_003456 [Neodothiora populina]|uniref:Uncharacterized protein n=1 Tax=Neodothiora populina TaxID=2781224 RepID=A0ABR3PEH1_9PEZI
MAMMPAALTGDEAKTQMHGLHMAGLAYTSREHVVEPHKDALWTIQDLHYQYIYRLCVLVAEGTKHPFSAAQAILLTMRLYAWTCVPEFIPEQVRVKVNYGPLMKRVSERGLNRLHKGLRRWPDLIEWWTTESQTKLECLLWVLFVAWSLSRIECKNQIFEPMPPFHGVDFFETKLRQVVKALGLERKEAIEKTLKVFPWVDHFSAENCEELWMRIN